MNGSVTFTTHIMHLINDFFLNFLVGELFAEMFPQMFAMYNLLIE